MSSGRIASWCTTNASRCEDCDPTAALRSHRVVQRHGNQFGAESWPEQIVRNIRSQIEGLLQMTQPGSSPNSTSSLAGTWADMSSQTWHNPHTSSHTGTGVLVAGIRVCDLNGFVGSQQIRVHKITSINMISIISWCSFDNQIIIT